MYDPNQHRDELEKYLTEHLRTPVKFVHATILTQSTRAAPWRMDVQADGVVKSYLLQLDPRNMALEYRALKALERNPLPTPHVYGLDLLGQALGRPCFFSDFISGETLLDPMLSGEFWAEDLYLEAVCQMQAVTAEQLGETAQDLKRESAPDVLEEAYQILKNESNPLADSAYQFLKASMPDLPPLRFSNGDLWLENFIVKDRKLAGIIDFANATFSDPIYEFLLSFFAAQELQGRGIEERYCRRIGYDPVLLHWYHGLEYFDTWRWVLVTGEPFVHHSIESLQADLRCWLDQGGLGLSPGS